MTDRFGEILRLRVEDPAAVARLAGQRVRPPWPRASGRKLMLIAADHPARGALRAGDRRDAMGERRDLLDRLCTALARPGVDGVLGTADVLEDLLLLGVLDRKVVIGSMNRGGIAGTAFEIDDRFTAYSASAVKAMGWQGGKMLLRIDPADAASASTLQSCADAVTDLAGHGLMAMVEPFLAYRVDGLLRNDLSTGAIVRSCTIAAGLGATSAYTWLKLPVVENMPAVLAATTLPVLLLGGEVGTDQEGMFAGWRKALAEPNAQGLVVGRSLLYPPDDDVAAAVDTAVGLLP